MKKWPLLSAIIFSLFACCSAWAQEDGTFTFQIQDYKGSAIQKARLIVLSGESHMASPGGVITYLGEINYVKKNGKMVQIREMPHYITVKAPGYKDRTIDLTQYALGSYIVVKLDKLDKMSSDYRSISVYVKDKNGKPVSGASVLVNPGKSTSTDANGYAVALHTILISGEYVMIEVYKVGYKIQRQYIPSGDASRMENGRQIPPNTAYFTLEKGENDATIFHINVEVLDHETDDAVPGAVVWLEISDETAQTGTTSASGEVRFSDMEYSFQGTTARVKVTKRGYEEKWSDITADLMTGKDNPERQFLIYLKKDKTVCWPGSYAAWDSQTQKTLCYCNPGLVWNSTKTACVDPKESGKGCTQADAAKFSQMSGSWKSYRLHVTIGGSCDKVTGTWKVTEWCEGVEETYNASVARVNGTLSGKMMNGYLQLSFESPPSPNNSKGTKGTGSCTLKSDGTLSCSSLPCSGSSGDFKKQ
jgi:hypothetical protein